MTVSKTFSLPGSAGAMVTIAWVSVLGRLEERKAWPNNMLSGCHPSGILPLAARL